MAIGAGVGWIGGRSPPLSEETAQQRLTALADARPEVDIEISITRGPASASVLAVSEEVAADSVVLIPATCRPSNTTQ